MNKRYLLILLCASLLQCGVGKAFSATVDINMHMALPSSQVLIRHAEVKSLMELRSEHVVLQRRDFSCGAASEATILRYYLDLNIHEIDAINGLLAVAKAEGTLEKIIERRGFSLLDLKRYAEALGFKSAGYRLEFQDLVDLGIPAIVPIIPSGYKHFVVFRGADDHFVYLADPSFGNLVESIAQFKADWYGYTNVALVIFRPENEKDKDKGPPPLTLSQLDKINVISEGLDSFLYQPTFEPSRYSTDF